MILEEETFKVYGHYPSALTHGSNKPVLAACDECGKVRETSKDQYRSLCLSCARKGKQNALGFKHTKEFKCALVIRNKGNTYALGHKDTEESKALKSVARKGDKNPAWLGGVSFEPYCVKFNKEFKEYIRSKFGYTCFLCPTTQVENGRALDVHHVNYNKNCGCDGDKTCKFVPLCVSCHRKTNFNRDYWQKIIMNKLHCTIIGWTV